MAPQERTQSRLRLGVRDLPYLLLIALAVGLALWDVFLLNKAFLSGDHLIQHYPWTKFLQDSIRGWRLPWWTSQIQCGFPLLAEGQIGAFYLPNLFFLFFLPLKWAYNYEILFHFILGGFLFYLYARHLGLSIFSSFFSTLIFLFGSTRAGYFYNLTSQRVCVWFPLTLLLVDRLIQKKSLRAASLLGLVFAMQVFAGYLQIAIYSIAFTTLYFILRITPSPLSSPPQRGRGEGEGGIHVLKTIVLYLFAALVGILVSSIQLFPTLELAGYSARAEAGEALAYVGSPLPFFLMTLLFPDWAGFWTGAIYVGILGLFFALVSLFTKKNGTEKLWIIIFIVALSLALGKFSPLYVLLVKVFKIYFFRIPTKFLFFAAFSLIVLAAYGFEKFLKLKSPGPGFRRAAFVFSGFFAVIVLSILTAHSVGRSYREPILKRLETYVEKRIYGQPYHPHDLQVYKEKLSSYYDYFLRLTSLKSPQTKVPLVLFGLQALAGFLILFKRKARARAAPILIALLWMDLFLYVQMSTRRDLDFYGVSENRSSLVERMQEDQGIFRIHEFNTNPLSERIFPTVPNQNMLYGLEDIGIYSPFAFSRYKKILGGLGGVDDSLYQNRATVDDLKQKRRLLDELNVKYVLSNEPLRVKGLKLIAEEKGVWLYQNKTYWPRAFYTERIDRYPRLKPGKEISIFGRGEGRMVLKTGEFDKGYAVFSEQNYPTWAARGDEEELLVIPLAAHLKAIPLSKRNETVELFYEPTHKNLLFWLFTLGIFVALPGIVLNKPL